VAAGPASRLRTGRGAGDTTRYDQWARLLPYLEDGTLDPLVGNSYPLEQAADALLELDERRALAKVLITCR
jgi:NADPH2:quinone reductase